MRAALLGVTIVMLGAGSTAALAQSSSPMLQGELPFDYSRGRNISVRERSRPEYQALGIPLGGFTLSPSLDITTAYTDNVYATPSKTADGRVDFNPELAIRSNWSRNQLSLTGGANIRRYLDEKLRNEDGWYVRGGGRYELGLNGSLEATARAEKLFESRFSPSTTINVLSSVPYRYNQLRLLGETKRGRFRFAASGSYEDYDFSAVVVPGGGSLAQDNRDRRSWTGVALAEYAVSPDMAVFSQLTYEDIGYDTELSVSVPNRDSKTMRIIGGVSLDLTTLLRGRVGLGFMKRNYDAAIYRNIGGLSGEAVLEYFPSELTTMGLTVRRRIDDASVTNSSGYISTSTSLRVDHELLRNLILNVQASYELGKYRGIISKTKVFRVNGGAHYLINRMISLGFDIGYGERKNDGVPTGPEFNETRGQVTVTFRK